MNLLLWVGSAGRQQGLACLPKAGRQAQNYLAQGGLAGGGCFPSGRKGAANKLCGSALLRAELLRCAPCCCAACGTLPSSAAPLAEPEPNGAWRARPGRCARAAGLPRHGMLLVFARCAQPPLPCGNPALPHSSTRLSPGRGPAQPCASEPPSPARQHRRSR